MKTLIYKGYIGSVEISDEDNCLFGKVLDLPKDTMISYEGETVLELKYQSILPFLPNKLEYQ